MRKMRKNWPMVFFIFVSLFIGQKIYQIYIREFPRTPTTRRPRVKVLLLGLGRSGTTFFGKFFRENKDVLYLFEPVRSTHLGKRDNESLQLLNDIYSCNRPDNIYFDLLLRSSNWVQQANLFSQHKNGMPQSFNRSSLATAIQDRCKQVRVIASKVLIDNLPDGGGLWTIKTLLDTHKDLKVVYLVRNPWRVFYSRKILGWSDGQVFRDYVRPICTTTFRSLQYIKNNSLYFKDRVKLVVSTEVMEKPFEVINDLYAFLDMSPVPSYMYTWILTDTKGSSKIGRGNFDPYNTYRNTTEVLRKKTHFTQEESSAIREHCHGVIKFIEKYKKDHVFL